MRTSLSIALLCVLPLGTKAQDLTPREIAASTRPAVVVVKAFEGGEVIGEGSGFFIGSEGRLVTNRHVVEGADALQVRLSTGEIYDQVYLVSEDERRDLVILRVPAVGMIPLEIGDDRATEVGDPVYVMGNPLGLEGTFTNGLISARRVVNGVALLQISAPISPGSSGGPVLNSAGRVIGVATLTLREGQNLNMAVPARYAAGLVAMNETPRPWPEVRQRFANPSSGAPEVSRSEIARPAAEAAPEDLPEWAQVLASEVAEVRRIAEENEVVETHEPVIEMLSEGERHRTEFSYRWMPVRVLFVAVCDVDCTDVDLRVYNQNGRLVDSDLSVGDRAAAMVVLDGRMVFEVEVSMISCSVEPCGFTLLAFGSTP